MRSSVLAAAVLATTIASPVLAQGTADEVLRQGGIGAAQNTAPGMQNTWGPHPANPGQNMSDMTVGAIFGGYLNALGQNMLAPDTDPVTRALVSAPSRWGQWRRCKPASTPG
jgi:hypothetical protein